MNYFTADGFYQTKKKFKVKDRYNKSSNSHFSVKKTNTWLGNKVGLIPVKFETLKISVQCLQVYIKSGWLLVLCSSSLDTEKKKI